MKTFTVGQSLKTRSICNSDSYFTGTVVKRTAKTVTVQTDEGEKRCKVFTNDEGEFIYPLGRYSMCPIFRA